MGILINGTTDTISAADGSLSVPSITNGINISGVSTLGNTVIGGATTEVVVTGSVDVSSTVTSVFGNFTALTASSNSGFHVDGGAPASSFLLGNTGNLSLGNDLYVTSGSVGIGTDNPTFELDLRQTGQADLLIGSYNAGGARLILDGDSNGDGSGGDFCEIVADTSGDLTINARNPASDAEMIFNTGGGSERLRITSSGPIGINTTTVVESAQVQIRGASDGVLNLDTTDGRGSMIRFKENGTSKAWVGCAEGLITGTDQDDLGLRAVDNIVFRAGSNEAARFNSSGNLVFPSGQGIDFSANTATGTGTTTSSVLDDYERGTWTPSFVQSGTTNNMYVNNNLNIFHADYVKIGNNVWISCYIQNDASFNYDTGRSGSDALGITGLPFTISNTPADSGYYAVNIGYFNNWTSWTAGYSPMGFFYTGQVGLALIYAAQNGTTNVQAQYMFSPNSAILLSGFYQTD